MKYYKSISNSFLAEIVSKHIEIVVTDVFFLLLELLTLAT